MATIENVFRARFATESFDDARYFSHLQQPLKHFSNSVHLLENIHYRVLDRNDLLKMSAERRDARDISCAVDHSRDGGG